MVECHEVVSACFNSRPVRCCLIRAAYSARALLDSSSHKVAPCPPRLGRVSSFHSASLNDAPQIFDPRLVRANQNTAFGQAESAILICPSQIRSLPKLLSNQGTARGGSAISPSRRALCLRPPPYLSFFYRRSRGDDSSSTAALGAAVQEPWRGALASGQPSAPSPACAPLRACPRIGPQPI